MKYVKGGRGRGKMSQQCIKDFHTRNIIAITGFVEHSCMRRSALFSGVRV